MAAKGSLADHSLGVGNRDPTEAGLDMYHEHDHSDRDDAEEEHREVADGAGLYIVVDRTDILRQRGDDAGENDEGDTVAHTLRRNLLAEPHEEDRSRGERDRDDQDVHRIGIEDCLLEADGHADGLEEGEDYREVACDLGGFLMPFFAFLTPLLERRNDDIQ